MGIIQKIFGNYSQKEIKRIEPIKDKVLELESKYEKMSVPAVSPERSFSPYIAPPAVQ